MNHKRYESNNSKRKFRNFTATRSFRESANKSISKPYIVGFMSVNGNREYVPDLSQLKFLNAIPKGTISLDLNHNIDTAVKRSTDDSDEKITLLLSFLLDRDNYLKEQMKRPSFISYRRTLINIMCNTYGTNEPIIIAATLFNGSIYLYSIETEKDLMKRKSRTKQDEKFCAWGYKFEQYLLSDYPNTVPDIHKPVVENEEFSLYYSTSFGDKQLLYGAQIDGLLATHSQVTCPPKTADLDSYLDYLRKRSFLELKTNKLILNRRQEQNFKLYKLLRCWCQCYLADLKGLLVGYRTDDGIIQHLQWFDTPEIVSYCKDVWNPQRAIDYLDYVLSFIQNSFKDYHNEDLKALRFDFSRDGRIVTSQLEKDIILPTWYVEKIKMNT